VYVISGIAYGMVELIRRVIPRDIVGGDVQRLRRMDAVVHVLYEVAGTTGAFTSKSMIYPIQTFTYGIAYVFILDLIDKFGYNNSYLLSPVFFGLAALVWRFIGTLGHGTSSAAEPVGLAELEQEERKRSNIFMQMARALKAFVKAFYVGMFLVMSRRHFVWLVSGYSFALYGHRYV
jgi:hypothetical protein